MKEKKSTFSWIFSFAGQKKSGYIASVILAVIGAAFQILPFFVMAQVIGKLLAGNKDLAGYLIDCAVMAAFWLLRVLFHSLSTAQSHKATFAVLGNIRKQGLAKLAKMPLGDVQAKGSGELKNILVERVDSIEPTLAHAIPEMSSNAAVALATLIYLFVIDWRMAFSQELSSISRSTAPSPKASLKTSAPMFAGVRHRVQKKETYRSITNDSLDTAEVRMESPRSIPSKRLQSKGSTKDFSPVTALPR